MSTVNTEQTIPVCLPVMIFIITRFPIFLPIQFILEHYWKPDKKADRSKIYFLFVYKNAHKNFLIKFFSKVNVTSYLDLRKSLKLPGFCDILCDATDIRQNDF